MNYTDKEIIEEFRKRVTPDHELNQLYQLVNDFNNLCNLVELEYFCDGGSLLGAVKFGTIIRYDDDADFIYIKNEENQKKLEIIFDLMKQLGNRVFYQIATGGYQIVPIGQYYPFIDIIPLYKKKKTYYLPKIIRNNPKFIVKKFTHHDLYPRKKIKYGDLTLWTMNNYKDYLDKSYPNWKKLSVYMGSHSFNSAIEVAADYAKTHWTIETKKLPEEISKFTNYKLKYDTLKKLEFNPHKPVRRVDQLNWLRINI